MEVAERRRKPGVWVFFFDDGCPVWVKHADGALERNTGRAPLQSAKVPVADGGGSSSSSGRLESSCGGRRSRERGSGGFQAGG